MVGGTVTEGVAFIDCPKIKCPRREDIRAGGRRETRTREPARSAIRARDIAPGDDDTFYILPTAGIIKKPRRANNKAGKSNRLLSENSICMSPFKEREDAWQEKITDL